MGVVSENALNDFFVLLALCSLLSALCPLLSAACPLPAVFVFLVACCFLKEAIKQQMGR